MLRPYSFCPLLSLFLHEMFPWYLYFPIVLFSSISLHWSLRKASLSLLAILWNSAFKWVYLSFSPLSFASLLSSAICKASSDNHFAFLHYFFLGMVLIPDSCTMSWTSIHRSSSPLPIRSNPLNLFVTSTTFVVILPKAHLTSHSRMSGSRWVTATSGSSGSLRPFCTVLLCTVATSS